MQNHWNLQDVDDIDFWDSPVFVLDGKPAQPYVLFLSITPSFTLQEPHSCMLRASIFTLHGMLEHRQRSSAIPPMVLELS